MTLRVSEETIRDQIFIHPFIHVFMCIAVFEIEQE